MVKFLDYMAEESFDFIFSNIFKTYIQKFLPDHKNKDFERLDVEVALNGIKDKTEMIAKNHGLKTSFMKKFNKVNMMVMGAFFGVFLLVQFIDLGAASSYIMFPLMLGMCFLPQVLKKKMMGSWKEFKYQHRSDVENEAGDEIKRVKEYIQIVIDETQDYLIEKEFPLQLVTFSLFSNSYKNLTLQKEQITNDQIQYLYHIAYPAGVKPFPTPGKIINTGSVNSKSAQSAPSDMEISDDNEKDLFVVLSNANYNELGSVIIKNPKFIKKGPLTDLIEKMLDDSKFSKVENPNDIISDLKNNKQIPCQCNESIAIGELQEVKPVQYPEFGFYLGIANKCKKCGANPFILFPTNNTSVPDVLKEIFQK